MTTPAIQRLFLNQDFGSGEAFEFGAVHVTALSLRSPARTTPNEDSCAILALPEGALVLAVADGVGGLRGGDLASRTAIEVLAHTLSGEGELAARVLRGFEAASLAVQELAVGAGSTLSVVTLDGTRVRTYHAGDSPILGVGQRGRIKLQPLLHSVVAYAVESGFLDERAALHHDDRHLVTSVLGNPGMRIEIGPVVSLAPRDTIVLASDGLFDNLHLEEVIETARKGPLREAAQALRDRCRQRMVAPLVGEPSKPDDLTILLLRRAA